MFATLRRAELAVRRDATLGTIMETLAAIHGDRVLVDEGPDGLCLTHRQAAKRVARWAGGIAARTTPGDRVVVATPNSYEQLLLCLATARAGAIPVPLNSAMRDDEVAHVVSDSGATLVLRDAFDVDGSDPLTKAAPVSTSDIGAIFYTSGTTGKPKGAELTHGALVGTVSAAALWPSRLHRDEAVVSLPIAHIMGFIVLLAFASGGVPVFLLPHFRPDDVLDAIESRRSTIFVGVPAMYRMLLEAGAEQCDLTSVRVWASGADVMPGELAQRFKKMGATVTLPLLGPLGESAFVEGYGMVETAGGVAAKISPPLSRFGLGDSLGLTFPGYKLRVVGDGDEDVSAGTVGELWVKGPGVIRGYWDAPDASAQAVTEDGWLRTGDLVRKGPFGTVSFVGRDKDVIKRGGYSVYAVEVQGVLEDHPDVLEAAVIGLPHDTLGEVPAAVVRLVEGAVLDDADLEAWARRHLADYKVPDQFVAVDELPRTGTNKVQKSELPPLFAT